jgi:hypothetical protein
MAVSARLLAAATALLMLSACEPMYGPPAPNRITTPAEDTSFRAADFAWSKPLGRNSLVGTVAYRAGTTRYSCAGATVVLTPETPWSRKRMSVLYQSGERAALPVDDVRGRAAKAPPGDSDPYVKKAICDDASRFSFAGLADGAWYVVTLAKPATGQGGPTVALMRRIVTGGGRTTSFDL